MPRMLPLADLHLGWSPRGLPDDRAAVRQRRRDGLLDQAVDVALAERVDLVVIAGDLFERHRPDEAMATAALRSFRRLVGPMATAALRSLRRLVDAGVALVTVPGNHDELSYADAIYRTEGERWPGVLVTRPTFGPVVRLRLAGTDVHVSATAYVGGVTPAAAPLDRFPRSGEPGVHLAVLHGTLVRSGSQGAFAEERSLPIDRTALAAAGFDYVALGHLHAALRSDGSRGPVVYPGCVGGKGFDDLGSRAWTLVDLAPGGTTVRSVPATVQRLETIDVDVGDFDDVAALSAHVRSLGDPDALVRVRLTGAVAFDLDPESVQAHAAADYLHLEVQDATSSIAPALLDALASRPTVLGAFVRRLRARLETALDDDERALVTRALRYGVNALDGEP